MVQGLSNAASLLDKVRHRASTIEDFVDLLHHYGMLPKLLQEILIDEAIAPITLTPEELFQASQQFYQKHQLRSTADVHTWLSQQGLTQDQLESVITRDLRIERYKHETWGHKLEHYFLQRKDKLDRVVYSLIRVKDLGIAQELFFRIQEREATFEDLAREHSLGVEAETGGLIGPVELGVPHPAIAKILTTSQPGQLIPPTRLGEWAVILRLEKFLPAQLDESVQQRLLNELFENWLKSEIATLLSTKNSESDSSVNGQSSL